MLDLIVMMFSALLVGLRGQAAMQAEIIALRHQLTVLQRNPETKAVSAQSWRSMPVGLAVPDVVRLAFGSPNRQA